MKLCLACEQQFDNRSWKCPKCGFTPTMESGHWILTSEMAKSRGSFNPDHFSRLARIEEAHWWFRSRRELVIWALRRYFHHFESFLEIGCGTGFMLSGIRESFPALSLAGGDLFGEGLVYASKRLPNASLFKMDARRIPFKEEFDVIGAFDVLEHIDEDEEALLQMFRALKRGGGLIVTVPQHPFLWSKQDRHSFHKRRYTKEGLVEKVKKVGFQERWSTSFIFLLLPLMFFVRLGRDKKDCEFDAFEELRISGSLNQALLRIMSVEISMLRKGLSLPVGGSLLLVAKKV